MAAVPLIPLISLGLTAAGTAASFISQRKQGQATQQQAQFEQQASQVDASAAIEQAEIDAINAEIGAEQDALALDAQASSDLLNQHLLEQEAKATLAKGVEDTEDFLRAGSAAQATSRARQAASGVTGASPLAVDEATFAEIETGAARVSDLSRRDAGRQKLEGAIFGQNADTAAISARLARDTGAFNAANIRRGGVLQQRSILAGGRAAGARGKAAKDAANLGAIGTLASGGAKIFGQLESRKPTQLNTPRRRPATSSSRVFGRGTVATG